MLKVVFLQLGVVAVVVAILGGILGIRGAASGLIGGAAYILPNLFFAIRLRMLTASGQGSAPGFMVGQILKLMGTIVFLAIAQQYYEVHWLAMLAGLFAALKANLFAFLLKT